MANNLEKILDLISKAVIVQQVSTVKQPQSTQTMQNTEPNANANTNINAAGNTEPAKYIYISAEDLYAMFPGLKDKLDITKITSALTDKLSLSKILSSLATLTAKSTQTNVQPQDEPKKENGQ
jgi:hypothetical protein